MTWIVVGLKEQLNQSDVRDISSSVVSLEQTFWKELSMLTIFGFSPPTQGFCQHFSTPPIDTTFVKAASNPHDWL